MIHLDTNAEARRYVLEPHRRVSRVIVRAKGTQCYLVKEDTILSVWGTPRTFLSVAEAQAAFAAVAPEGWESIVEPAPIRYGAFGTGRIASDRENPHEEPH